MKAAVLKGAKKLVVEEVSTPKPGPGQVLAKIKYCGISGSILHFFGSSFVPAGSIIGHVLVGEVIEVGSGVSLWKLGDRVWPGGSYFGVK